MFQKIIKLIPSETMKKIEEIIFFAKKFGQEIFIRIKTILASKPASKNFWGSLIRFAKYHNGFNVILVLIFIISSSAFADESVRNAVLGEKIVTEQGVDNSALLATNLDKFDLAMKITNVTQDRESALTPKETGSPLPSRGEEGNYYIDYEYKTMAIQDGVWKPILRRKQMTIAKTAIEGRDLGLYATEELGEIIDYEIAYLKEVQKNEEEKGRTFVRETTEYTGLIGLILNTQTKELPGYEPVIEPPEIITQPELPPIAQPTAEAEPPIITPAPTAETTPASTPLTTPEPTAEAGTPTPTPTTAAVPAPSVTSQPSPEATAGAATPTPTPTSTPEVTPTPTPTPTPEVTPAPTPAPTPASSPEL